MGIGKEKFGTTEKGETATLYTLSNKSGMTAKFTDYGAILVSLLVPDKQGKKLDVVHGFDNLQGYFDNPGYFGSTIGRNGNRIAQASFELNGETYHLDQNEGENNLHSGFNGYHKRLWKADEIESGICFSLVSPDLDQGFPGEFHISVTYTLSNDNTLQIEYKGVSSKDTIANLTNHSYFNLSGHNSGTAMDHILTIFASSYTPVIDSGAIPTGEVAPVEGTPMDFREAKVIGERIDSDFSQLAYTGGYDHNYVLDDRSKGLKKAAIFTDPMSGRSMEVYTDCPGIQFYAGNFISGQVLGKEQSIYKVRSAVCLETQYFPDAIHNLEFPSPVLKKGEEYHSLTQYKFV